MGDGGRGGAAGTWRKIQHDEGGGGTEADGGMLEIVSGVGGGIEIRAKRKGGSRRAGENGDVAFEAVVA